MRDPARIGRILGKLTTVWQAQPDARLCQLLVDEVNRVIAGGGSDISTTDDDVVESALNTAGASDSTVNPALVGVPDVAAAANMLSTSPIAMATTLVGATGIIGASIG